MLCDAHNHLHDARLAPHRPAIFESLRTLDLRGAVVNGTREEDWGAVAALAREHSWITPSFGLHPWHVPQRSPDWLDALRRALDEHPRAGIGDVGLDRWIKGHDIAGQLEVLQAQAAIAAAENRPLTIHCIQAWGTLLDFFQSHPAPARGFLLHSFGGPLEMIGAFAELGAFFSFPPYFLHPRKASQRERFRHIPCERLLIETDAPDMWPPDDCNPHPLRDSDGRAINHPANLALACEALARVRGLPPAGIARITSENFARLFGEARR